MRIVSLLPKQIAKPLRKLKAALFSIRARVAMFKRKLGPKSPLGTAIVLSFGGVGGSAILARSAFELGYDVHVISPEFPSYEGRYARGWTKCDPVNDLQGTLAAARMVGPVSALVEIRNVLLPAKSLIHRELGLRDFGTKSVITSNSKIAMREAIGAAGLPQVKWCLAENYKHGDVGFPAIVKPEKGTGSRGVTKVSNEQELRAAISTTMGLSGDVTVGGRVLIEEFIDGPNFDVTGVFRDGEIYPFIVQAMQFTPVNGAMPAKWYLLNAPIDETLRQDLIDHAKRYLLALGVQVGAFTCEMRISPSGKILITDFGNRCATPPTTTAAAGLSLTTTYARAMIDKDFEIPQIERNIVYQVFIREKSELEKFDRLIAAYPDLVLEERRLASDYAGVSTLSRLSLISKNKKRFFLQLTEFDLIPPEWSEEFKFDWS